MNKTIMFIAGFVSALIIAAGMSIFAVNTPVYKTGSNLMAQMRSKMGINRDMPMRNMNGMKCGNMSGDSMSGMMMGSGMDCKMMSGGSCGMMSGMNMSGNEMKSMCKDKKSMSGSDCKMMGSGANMSGMNHDMNINQMTGDGTMSGHNHQ